MTPTDPKRPGGGDAPEQPSPRQTPETERRRTARPGGHGSYKIGDEPATGHRWDEAPPPPPAPSGRYVAPPPDAPVNPLHAPPSSRYTEYDDGVLHDPHTPGDLLHNVAVDHEHADVNVRALIGSAVVLVVIALAAHLLMWVLFGLFRSPANDPAVSPLSTQPAAMPRSQVGNPVFSPETVAGPQLLTNEPMALEKQRDREQKLLHGYGWVNQGAGVARMPIDEAKKLIEQRGLPVREGDEVSPTLGSRLPARGESSGGRIITATPAAPPAETPATAPEGGAQQPAQGAQPGRGTSNQGEQPAAKPHGPGGPGGR